MYFDEALWLALHDYVAAFDDQAMMWVIEDWRPETKGLGAKRADIEIEPEAFMERWRGLPAEDRDPPGAILLRRDGQIVLWVVTEYWNRIGGPCAHHDSYTYSLFSDRDLAEEVRRFLMARPEAPRWRMEAPTA